MFASYNTSVTRAYGRDFTIAVEQLKCKSINPPIIL